MWAIQALRARGSWGSFFQTLYFQPRNIFFFWWLFFTSLPAPGNFQLKLTLASWSSEAMAATYPQTAHPGPILCFRRLLWPVGEWREQNLRVGLLSLWRLNCVTQNFISKDLQDREMGSGWRAQTLDTFCSPDFCLSRRASSTGLPDLFCPWGTETTTLAPFSHFLLLEHMKIVSFMDHVDKLRFFSFFPIELLVGNFAY